MRNPFQYGSRVSGGAFFNRTKIKRDMQITVEGGNNIVLYGPRRYGKSSLVGEIINTLRQAGWVCIELNMMDVVSLEDFISQYTKAIYREAAPTTGTLLQIVNLFKRVSPRVGIDDEGRPELKFEMVSRKAEINTLREVLDLPKKLCPPGKTLIAIDEFQEVEALGLGGQFERTMRTVIQEHADIAYIFLGSKTHLLERMFSSAARPFYNAAQKFMLGQPPVDESVQFVMDRFASVGISIERDIALEIVKKAGNVPYYIQAIGAWVFNATRGDDATQVTLAHVEDGFSAFYATEICLLENLFASRPKSQRLLMRALAKAPTDRFDEAYRQQHALASTSTVNTALKRLLTDALVEWVDGKYILADPLLAYHLRP